MPYQLHITITGKSAVAQLDTDEPGASYGPVELQNTELRLWTVGTLQAWLSRWHAIYRLGQEVLVTETLEALGRNLYEMLFQGAIEDAFRAGLAAARRSEERFRILLQFSEDSGDFARLPWELLCEDGGELGEQQFLALKTDLMLNRTVRQTMGMARFDPAEPPLRVLVILALPNDRPAADVRSVLENVNKGDDEEAGKVQQLEVSFVDGWDLTKLKMALQQHPQVVHFVGHARYIHGNTTIELPSAEGTYEWRSAKSFVNLLERDGGKELPRLVFLHLRDRGDSDFTATFERLAPALIRAKIPLVLAMQYPMPERATKAFLDTLYGDLASGEEFDYAVQNARACMHLGEGDISPFLGTPVLYMHSESSRLVRPPPSEEPSHEPSSVRVSTQPSSSQAALKALLSQLAVENTETGPDADELIAWVHGVEWAQDPVQDQRTIQQQLKNDAQFPAHRAAYSAMIKAVRSSSERAR